MGYFISCLSPSQEAAAALTAILVLPFALLGGFFLNGDNVPVYLVWLSELSMFKWGFKLLLINQFYGVTFVCPPEPELCLYPNGAAVFFLFFSPFLLGPGCKWYNNRADCIVHRHVVHYWYWIQSLWLLCTVYTSFLFLRKILTLPLFITKQSNK